MLFAGAFAVSYLMMPGSFYRSGIVLASLSMFYSAFINSYSTTTILQICKEHTITGYFEFYNHTLTPKYGFAIFVIFLLNSFIITVATLMSLNEMMTDIMKVWIVEDSIFTNPFYCFWAVAITLLTTPFVYKSTDESLSLITVVTFTAIILSLFVVMHTFFTNGAFNTEGNIKFFDFKGTTFSFDVSYFSFIVQLNLFDLFNQFSGSDQAKFDKIQKTAHITNYMIFVPYFIMGNIFYL